jgi:anti-sigma regulatory factor (Ser/Thr protein kinase)
MSRVAAHPMTFSHLTLSISETSQVGEARRLARRLATEAQLDETTSGRVAIVATELATNLARYAPGGELLMRAMGESGRSGIELLSIDRGPGMPEVRRCLEDGYSSGGSAGTGLGAIHRLSTEFDIHSTHPGGTVVLARVGPASHGERSSAAFRWGFVTGLAPRETECGDTWRLEERDGNLRLLIADGLGHGPLAATAAGVAAGVFDEDDGTTPLGELVATAHRRMRATRGAALALAHIESAAGMVRFVGVGNIAGSIRALGNSTSQGLMSHNGTVGAEMRKVQQLDYPWTDDSLLIMHSDGLQTRWSLDAYPGLLHRHPAVIAGVLYRDFRRERDDVTVAIVRQIRPQSSRSP